MGVVTSLMANHRRVALRELRLVVLEPILFYVAMVTLPMTRRERWRVLDAWIAGALGVALYGLVQYFLLGDVITTEGGIRRLHSLYGSPNNVGLYLGRVLPVMVAVVLGFVCDPVGEERPAHRLVAAWGNLVRTPRRLAYLVALAPIGIALLLSFSRGALVLGVPGALVALGLLAGKPWRRFTVVALVIGVLILIPVLRMPQVASRLEGLFDLNRGTAGFRLALWYSSLGMVRDHPFLGVGLDNFLYAYRTRYVLPTAWEEFNLSHPHNVLLDFTTRLGLPGLVILFWSQATFWRAVLVLHRTSRGIAYTLTLGIAASMVDFWAHGLVDASYFVIDLAFVYTLSLAVVAWLAAGWPDGAAAWDVGLHQSIDFRQGDTS
jgi:O-antigen ligase